MPNEINYQLNISYFQNKNMPQSKKRKHHHEYRAPANAVKAKKGRSAVVVSSIFFGLIGIGIAYFAMVWLIIGAIAGATGGYFFGRQIDKSFSKK